MYRVLKQPNGKWCVYDTVIDKFVYINITDIYADILNDRAKHLYYGRNPDNPQTLVNSIDLEFTADWLEMSEEKFAELSNKMNDKDGMFEDFTEQCYHTKEREQTERIIKMYSDGYNVILKELQENQDKLFDTIRLGNVESVTVTIKIEPCDIPRYEIKYNHIPKLN